MSTYDTTDTALLQRWTRHRDADAFAELVARHGGMVYGACRRVLGDSHDAQDAAQESFIELMRAQRPITASLPGWLHTVAVRRSLDRIKESQRRRRREEVFAAKSDEAVEIDPDDLLAVVDEAIAAQPETYRAPIVLRFLEGKTHTDIGAQLGIAESTVRHRIEKGVEQVRETLRKQGVVVGVGILAAALEGQSAQAAPASLVAALGRAAVIGAVPAATAGILGAGFWAFFTKALVGVIVAGAAGIAVWTVTRSDEDATPVKTGPVAATKGIASPPASNHIADEQPGGRGTGNGSAAPPTASAGALAPVVVAAAGEKEPPAVSGRVYDKDTGAGIPDAHVQIWDAETGRSSRESVATNAEGYYEIRDLAPGRYRFTPRAGKAYPGTQYKMGPAVTLEEGKPVTGLDFPLKRGIRVTGQVVDTSGAPVQRADVRVRTKELPNPEYAETNDAGAFEAYLETPSEALYVCAYSPQMFGQIVEGLSLPPHGVSGITIILDAPRTASVSGTVVDPEGRPMKGLHLHLRDPNALFSIPLNSTLQTAADGAFKIDRLIAGKYDLGLTPPDVTMWSTADVAAQFELTTGQRLQGLRIVYGEKGGLAISGVVVDTSGKPITDVRVTAWGPKQETAHTNESGRFLITGLDEGAYNITTDHPMYTFGGKGGIAAGTADVELVLQGKGRVRGRITDANTGKPVPLFEVSFINGAFDTFRPELMQNGQDFQDDSGAFELTQVWAGPVTVTAHAEGYASAYKAVTVVEHEAAEADFALHPSEPVSGKVLDPAGNPVRDAFVFLPGPSVAMLYVKQQALAQTDEKGVFVIDGLPVEVNTIAAYAPPFGPAMASVRRGLESVILTLPEAGVIEGRVVAPGVDLSMSGISARYTDRPDFVYYHTKIEPDGTFRITGVAPGQLELQADIRTSGRSAQALAIVASGQTTPLDLVFEEGTATVSGQITFAGQAPDASSVFLEVTTQTGAQGYRANVQANGAYTIEGVVAGSATLKAYAAPKENPVASEQREVTVAIAPGAEVVQDIEF